MTAEREGRIISAESAKARLEGLLRSNIQGPWLDDGGGVNGPVVVKLRQRQDGKWEPDGVVAHVRNGDARWLVAIAPDLAYTLQVQAEEIALLTQALAATEEDLTRCKEHERKVHDEIAHAGFNGHRLDRDCQGVAPGEVAPAVRVSSLLAALGIGPGGDG